ncbi:unnamed protein product [Prunus armeniaca]|uniref:Uncharacterized protein n=1 Tax=Prunus armeniaca TaxID=36596 RepID=A0A6J5TDN6_PRUAR|nr:unnamed protein product [Prunus armeniaca]
MRRGNWRKGLRVCENLRLASILGDDILSCLRSWSEEASDVQTSTELQFEDNSGCGKPGTLSSADLGTRDDISEISIEDHSSSATWE